MCVFLARNRFAERFHVISLCWLIVCLRLEETELRFLAGKERRNV